MKPISIKTRRENLSFFVQSIKQEECNERINPLIIPVNGVLQSTALGSNVFLASSTCYQRSQQIPYLCQLEKAMYERNEPPDCKVTVTHRYAYRQNIRKCPILQEHIYQAFIYHIRIGKTIRMRQQKMEADVIITMRI